MNTSEIKAFVVTAKGIWDFLNTDVSDLVNDIIDKTEHKLSFNEFATMLGTVIDEMVIEIEKKENIICHGGELKLTIDNEKNLMLFIAEMYFKTTDGKWLKKEKGGSTRLSKFHDSANHKIKEISEQGEYIIEIEPPQK